MGTINKVIGSTASSSTPLRTALVVTESAGLAAAEAAKRKKNSYISKC